MTPCWQFLGKFEFEFKFACLSDGLMMLFRATVIFLSYGGIGTPDHASGSGYIDPRFKRVLWYLIGSTKGGINRARILQLLNSKPTNANQIATELKLDYKTVLHHIKVLSDNGLIITDNKDLYGATYFLTPLMENNYKSFLEILSKIKLDNNMG